MQEKETAFKHWINPDVLKKYAAGLKKANPQFDDTAFLKLQKEIPKLELKQRVMLIAQGIHDCGKPQYNQNLNFLMQACKKENITGFELWPATHYIQTYGLNSLEESMDALYILTQKFTAEFAIRPFINKYHLQIHTQFKKWLQDPNVHVRRWISEGTRPKLPWGEKLPALIRDPKPNLELLEALKFDPELYVRKSVSNHLNDITKEHPELVVKTLKKWQQECPKEFEKEFDFIVKQALRTLIKKGYPPALKLIGVAANNPDLKVKKFKLTNNKLKLGSKLNFTFDLENTSHKKNKYTVDYIIYYKKSNGALAPKVFKLKTSSIDPKSIISFSKNHSIKKITTRKHYPGTHAIALMINGIPTSQIKFELYGV